MFGNSTNRITALDKRGPGSDVQDEESRATGLVDAPGETSNWAALVTRIQRNESQAMEDLYNIFSRGIRYFLCRQLGPQELDDKVHDTFLIVVQAIQRGELREPERLMGFVRTIVRRQVASYIDDIVQNRREGCSLELDAVVPDARKNPEQNAGSRDFDKVLHPRTITGTDL
jgi:DNA-directed RNA polymerase specialized sigma24 family protein